MPFSLCDNSLPLCTFPLTSIRCFWLFFLIYSLSEFAPGVWGPLAFAEQRETPGIFNGVECSRWIRQSRYKRRRFSLLAVATKHAFFSKTALIQLRQRDAHDDHTSTISQWTCPHMLHTHIAECHHVPACRRWPMKRSWLFIAEHTRARTHVLRCDEFDSV